LCSFRGYCGWVIVLDVLILELHRHWEISVKTLIIIRFRQKVIKSKLQFILWIIIIFNTSSAQVNILIWSNAHKCEQTVMKYTALFQNSPVFFVLEWEVIHITTNVFVFWVFLFSFLCSIIVNVISMIFTNKISSLECFNSKYSSSFTFYVFNLKINPKY
jgi:hypothetical protein